VLLKKSAMTLVLGVSGLLAHADTVKTTTTAQIGARTLAVGQGNHVLDAVGNVLAVNPEFTTLLSLGTLFIGAAVVFSLRRPTV
jgi:hypothetical protein